MKRQKICKKCEQRPAVINFCNECAREINRAHESVFQRTEAAIAYLNGLRMKDTPAEMAAFLSIFHPELPDRRVRELIAATRSK